MTLSRWEDDGGPPGFTPEPYPPRMSRDELKKFVMGWCNGQVFSSWDIEQRHEQKQLPMVFMPIALGALVDIDDADIRNIGLVWEWLDKAGRTGISGMPIFFSCHCMHRHDWDIARDAINRELDRRGAVEL